MPSKPDLVILEGPDKAGKSTIYQAFRKATDYQPLVIDRFIGSNIVYDQLHGRALFKHHDSIKKYYELEKELLQIFNPLLVYLHAPVDVLLERSIKAGDLEEEKYDIQNIVWYYREYRKNTVLDDLCIDTSVHTVEEVVKAIQWQLNHRQKEVKNQWSE